MKCEYNYCLLNMAKLIEWPMFNYFVIEERFCVLIC